MPTVALRVILRTKETTVDSSFLVNRELGFGSVEKSIFVKDYLTNNLLKFSPVIDTTSTGENSVWSSSYTKAYVDLKPSVVDSTSSLDSTSVWSRSFTKTYIDSLPQINDSTSLMDSTSLWSRNFTKNYVDALPDINDSTSLMDSTSLWSRSFTKNYIDALPDINDSTASLDSTSLWSRNFIKTYIDTRVPYSHTHDYYTDIINSPTRSILLSAGGISPHINGAIACGYPEASDSSGFLNVQAIFQLNQVGYWAFLIPEDYKGSVSRITICCNLPSDTTAVWTLQSTVATHGNNIDSGGILKTPCDITCISSGDLSFTIANKSTSTSDLLGSSADVNKLVSFSIELSSYTGSISDIIKLYSIKLEYI